MASNDGRIGCTTGRAKIIDPNDFNGFSSSSNVPVQLEDLNISVVLTTYKKPRTNLTTTTEGSSFESSREFRVNFIEGSYLGGKKVLTTKYTDLTTSFEKGVVNEETLGISSIDIEFNSAMAPMVTINFIDVRGSSIFQNEENITGGYNKYSVFFQLPYPLFELEIKGYYGLPVKYCLHMLKFNSKFNSQTGNFEITCNFIGYSYAMLSDTLLGYLKVINYTKIGSERYTAYNSTRKEPILDLQQLMLSILNINKDLKKVAENDPTSTEYNATQDALEALNLIEANLNTFYENFNELNTDKEDKTYTVFKSIDFKTKENEINTFKENIRSAIEGEDGYNTLSESDKFDINNYLSLTTNTVANGAKLYKDITKKMLAGSVDSTLKLKLGTQPNDDVASKKQKLSEYLKKYYDGVGPDEKLDIIDFSLQFEEVKKKRVTTEEAKLKSQKALAEKFQGAVRDRLGFEPTVRNVIECFTAAIEVFIETIYQVSTEAEKNNERTQELAKKFKADDTQTSDIDSASIEATTFYPWPDYREKDGETGAYVEKYLGASGVLESPEKVNELVFIEDLLKAFRKAKKEQDEAVALAETEGGTAWIASSPLDSIVFGDTNPYSRSENKTKEDFMRILLIRAMTFLGYSNDPDVLKPEEIQAMGAIEAEAMLNGAKKVDSTSGVLRQSLSKITVDNIKNIEGTINDKSIKVIKEEGNNYSYDYIVNQKCDTKTPSNTPNCKWRIIPVNKGFNKENWGDPDKYTKIVNSQTIFYKEWVDKRDDEEYLFLTNYSGDKISTTKHDDGGTYLRIFNGTEFPTEEGTVPLPEGVTSDNVLILEKLKQMVVNSEAGFNSFGGGYGAQNFNTMDWGDDTLKNLQLMYVFYNNTEKVGLSSTRKENTATYYDFKEKPTAEIVVPSPGNMEKVYKTIGGAAIRENLGKNRNLFVNYDTSVSYPYVMLKYNKNKYFSLFGSELYYNQSYAGRFKKYNRALLFLHSLPFNKTKDDNYPGRIITTVGPYEIKHLFDSKAGFIHAPRLWCAYLGGILWRYDKNKPIYNSDNKIIGGGSNSFEPIAWNVKNYNANPVVVNTSDNEYAFDPSISTSSKKQYLPENIAFYDEGDYQEVNRDYDIWPNLPLQVKKEFKRIFFEFVNGEGNATSFDDIAEQLEIFNGDVDGKFFHSYLINTRSKIKQKQNGSYVIKSEDLLDSQYIKADVIKRNYSVVTPMQDDFNKFFLFLEIKDGSEAANILKKALTEESVIANNSYALWTGFDSGGGNERKGIEVSKTNLDLYLNSVVETLKKKGDEYSPTKETENIDIELFGTSNKDIIRLQLYRTCKNIYDKWLGGATDINTVMYQCGGRGSIDEKLAKKYQNTATKFIDSFRFVNRSFRDIGDLLYVNPLPINDFLVENQNMSAYDAISSVLASNKFEFQALPNFINFNNDETLKAIFKPYSYYDKAIEQGICGPSFVCVYAGQTSKHLDYRGGNYPNDGFDLRCIDGSPSPAIPSDFIGTSADYEDVVGAFTVKYSQQNQNIFKDIVLDQSEFSETDESLQIQDDISQKGAENNRSLVGQNIYNVYAVRSYNAQIEMMGNAMIQPMMYFQLDNIPMFHGAYMIINVKHSIKPNSMSTNFKGVRIRYPETPLITAYDVYMDLIATLDTSGAGSGTFGGSGGGGGRGVNGSFAPIVVTIIDNGGVNGNIITGNINMKPIPKIAGVENSKLSDKAENLLLTEAVEPLENMLKDFVAWLKSNGFKGINGNYVSITSVFRDYQKQVQVKAQYGSAAATPGTSNHGWGIAVDLQFQNKQGTKIPNKKNTTSSFKFDNNPAIKWIYDNSYKYGWVMPKALRDGSGLEEHWHIEYHGTAAKCIIENSPTIYGYTINVNPSEKLKSFVKNPKTKDGKEAVYNGCDFKSIKKEADGAEGGGAAAQGCKSPNYSFPFADPLPPADKLSIPNAIKILKKLPSSTGRAVFAIIWAEAAKTKDRTAFSSAGGHNYSGVQTDGGKWGAPGIIGQFCRVDSGGNKRAFAIFESDETFLKFMASRVEAKGFNGNDGDSWTQTYINSWWSPAAKKSYTKGTSVYNSKLSIYNTAMKKWDAN